VYEKRHTELVEKAERSRQLSRGTLRWEVTSKFISMLEKWWVCGHASNSAGSGYNPVAASCEHGNEFPDSIKDGQFSWPAERLSTFQGELRYLELIRLVNNTAVCSVHGYWSRDGCKSALKICSGDSSVSAHYSCQVWPQPPLAMRGEPKVKSEKALRHGVGCLKHVLQHRAPTIIKLARQLSATVA
jgi:hypothetical protein